MKKQSDDFSGRIRFITILLFIFAGILIYRLFDLQIISAGYWRDKANYQYVASQSKSPITNRGTIYFTEKSGQLVSAAVIKDGFSAIINPATLKNPEEVYDKIYSIIPLEREEFLRQAKKENDAFEIIGRRLEQDKADALKKMAIAGLDVIPEEWRFYPGENLASHVLGFVGEKSGQYGIEKSFEEYLKGTPEDTLRNSFAEAFFGLSREIFSRSLTDKKDVVLTIEPRVQGFLETALEKIMDQYSAESGGGIIIEPKTGKILAMAAKPDFDPNFYNKVKNLALFLNPLISNVFEMGSVFKPLTVSSALDMNSITAETTYFDSGYLMIDKSKIQNYDAQARGKVNMQTVLNKSLNTGAVFAMRQLGKENFKNYVMNFGLSEKTGVSLPNEAKGDISGLNSPREIEYATASYGQGIALTPIGFTAAFSALANGGFLIEPYIVENSQNKPIIKRQVLKKETSEEITRMLVRVVDEALLDGKVKLARYTIAAKTGTAQIPLENKKGYEENLYLHAFVGYAPAFDARFLTFLYLKRPQGVRYAANSLTPAFMDITKFLLNYYEVAPDR